MHMHMQQHTNTHTKTMHTSNSNSMEERWVQEKEKIFSRELKLDIDDFECPSVFRVPRALAEAKPEAYAPQILGLGPFHHQRLDLYPMQRKKLAAVVEFLGPDRMATLAEAADAVENVQEYQIRASYHDQLDASPKALAWIIAIDSVYLLHFLINDSQNIDDELAADVLKLENQIPATFVMGTLVKLGLYPSNMSDLVFYFCRRVSPLELRKLQIVAAVWRRKGHLLSMMYHAIIDTQQVTFGESSSLNQAAANDDDHDQGSISIRQGRSSMVKKPSAIGKSVTDESPTGLNQIDTALSLFDKVWRKMTGMFKSVNPDYEANRGVQEIHIPSVSQLEIHAGIKIAPLPSRGRIKEIKFDEREKKLLLPHLTFHSNTEVILRNLCAYEEAQYKSGLMGEYADLMCGIIDTAEDVKKLRAATVITSELGDKEIADVFCGKMRSSSSRVDKEEMKSNVGEAIMGVNQVYDQSMKVRSLRMIWKVVGRMRNCIIFLVILGVVCSLLMSTVCQFHDCQKL